MLRTLAISALSFAGAVSVANADVFRWVDDHGGVHYSDQWVPGSEVIKTTGTKSHSTSSDSAPRPSEQGKLTAASQRAAEQVNQQDASQAVKQDVAKAREQQCKDAKDRYDKAIQARRIYKPTQGDKSTDGDRPDDRQYLSDEEADAYRLKARTDLQEFCGAAAAKQAADGT
jgi:hypothetical protein